MTHNPPLCKNQQNHYSKPNKMAKYIISEQKHYTKTNKIAKHILHS